MTSTGTAPQVVAETDIALRDGSTVHVRPSTIEDVGRVRAFLESLSEESRWFRFFGAGVDLDAAARSAAAPSDGLSLIALRGSEATIVGHGTYIRGAGGRRSPSRWPMPGTAMGSPPCCSRISPCLVDGRYRHVHRDRPRGQPPDARGVPRIRVPGLRPPV